MDPVLNALYEALAETLYIDLKGAVPPSESQIKRFRDYFAIESDTLGLAFNKVNLIFTDEETFKQMEGFIKTDQIISRAHSREHNLFLVVYPYFNDPLIKQALEP